MASLLFLSSSRVLSVAPRLASACSGGAGGHRARRSFSGLVIACLPEHRHSSSLLLRRVLPASLPPPPSPSSAAGMKWVAEPKKRCRNCYFEVIDEIKYVFCTVHPRHKQGQRIVRQKFRMTLTHATQGAHCRKTGRGRREMWTQQSFRQDY